MSYCADQIKKHKFYYNVSIPHNDQMSIMGSPTPAVFFETRNEPLFCGKPKEYHMAVTRFTVPTAFIPYQYFPVIENPGVPTDPNYSLYSITLRYLGTDYKVNLVWITQAPYLPVPPPPTGITLETYRSNPQYLDYYSLYSLNHFCTIINNALSQGFFINIVPLLPVGPTYQAPYFSYNGGTNLFALYTQNIFLDTQANPINIFFNTSLNGNFDTSFDVDYFAYTAPQGANVKFNILDRGDNKIVDATSPGGFIYKQMQEFDSTGQILSFTSLIIRSNTLPIVSEALSLQSLNTGNANTSESIISDFEVDLATAKNIKGYIHYIPTAEYRRITLLGNNEIQTIDIEILWKDNFDNLYPVLIPAHDVATIKILFEEI